jgi:Pin2-interacting protein X1
MAASNSTALAEILGIPSSSTSSLSSRYPSTAITPSFTPTPAGEQEPLQTLTTSSQSVGDYFKAKLSAKTHRERQPAVGDNASTPRDEDDDDHRPGLGLGRGASRMPVMDGSDEEQALGGIGVSSSSKFAAMFKPSQVATDSREDNATAAIEARDTADQDDDHRKREKKRAKEERRREKEVRRRRKAEAGRLDGAVVDVPVGEASAVRTKKKKHNEPGTPDGDTQVPSAGGTEVVRTKKRKGDKDKKSAKHGRAAE